MKGYYRTGRSGLPRHLIDDDFDGSPAGYPDPFAAHSRVVSRHHNVAPIAESHEPAELLDDPLAFFSDRLTLGRPGTAQWRHLAADEFGQAFFPYANLEDDPIAWEMSPEEHEMFEARRAALREYFEDLEVENGRFVDDDVRFLINAMSTADYEGFMNAARLAMVPAREMPSGRYVYQEVPIVPPDDADVLTAIEGELRDPEYNYYPNEKLAAAYEALTARDDENDEVGLWSLIAGAAPGPIGLAGTGLGAGSYLSAQDIESRMEDLQKIYNARLKRAGKDPDFDFDRMIDVGSRSGMFSLPKNDF